MGKKKTTGEYNNFLDGEKLRDNQEVRTSLQHGTEPSSSGAISPPPTTRRPNNHTKSRSHHHKGPPKPHLTHFLCLPLVTPTSRPQLDTSIATLKHDLASTGTIPPEAVRPVGTLHLTLGVMSLDPSQLDAALAHLGSLDLQKLLSHVSAQALAEAAAEQGAVSENLNASAEAIALGDATSLAVQLRGLVPMQRPEKTSILYAEPSDAEGRLLPFAERVRREFAVGGFVIEEKRTLRLHATIVNTIYAKKAGRRGGGRGGAGGASGNAGAEAAVSDNEALTAQPDPSTAESPPVVDAAPKLLDGRDGHGPDAKSWLKFDARELIERYQTTAWAEDVRIDRVQICKMGAKKVLDERGGIVGEEYEVVGEKLIAG